MPEEDRKTGSGIWILDLMRGKVTPPEFPLNELGEICSEIKVSKGFEKADWNDAKAIASKLALIHSEVSEALEEVREPEDHLDKFHEELADVLIRTLELMYETGAHIDNLVWSKIKKNRDRPYLHGKKKL